MGIWTNGRIDEGTNAHTHTGGQTDGRMDGWMSEWVNERTIEWMIEWREKIKKERPTDNNNNTFIYYLWRQELR